MSQKYKVFIVDDEEMVRKMVSHKLKTREDLELHIFKSGEECIENIHLRPEVVLLDFHMDSTNKTNMNGMQTLMKIREKSPESKVAMLSSQDSVQVAVEILKKGAVDYIIKNAVFPVSTESAIDKILQGLKLKDEIRQLSETIKRDKLLMRGYLLIAFILLVIVLYFML